MALTLFSELAEFVFGLYNQLWSIYAVSLGSLLLMGAFAIACIFRFVILPFVESPPLSGGAVRAREKSQKGDTGGKSSSTEMVVSE